MVIPKNGFFGAQVGDLVAIVNRARAGAVTFAIVGDTGPENKFAEGNVALNRAVHGLTATPSPRVYRDVLGLDRDIRKIPQGLDILIMSGSRLQTIANATNPSSKVLIRDLTPGQIRSLAAANFARWGGKRRLEACQREIDRNGPPSLLQTLFSSSQ